jgi:hypothetical protein
MNIQPTCVSFEQAKWLKEKGFDEETLYFYNQQGKIHDLEDVFNYGGEGGMFITDWYKKYNSNQGYVKDVYSAPEQWQVVEWLRVNRGIWIQVNISKYGMFYCNILENQPTKNIDVPMSYEMICQLNDFKAPQEAYSAAFDYIINHLL